MPRRAEEHYNKAYDYVYQGLWHPAIQELNLALMDHPDYAEAYCLLALIYETELDAGVADNPDNHRKKIIDNYQEAIRIKPHYAEAHYRLGMLYQEKQGKHAEAIDAFRTAMKHDPDIEGPESFQHLTGVRLAAHHDLGIAYMKRGKFDRAIAEFREALLIDPDNAKVGEALETAELHMSRSKKRLCLECGEKLSLGERLIGQKYCKKHRR